jgi:hypothetical protein
LRHAAVGERNLRLNGRAFAQSGFDIQGAAHVGSSLAHAEQTKAALSFSFGRVMIRVEADPVVIDRQLNKGAAMRQMHPDVAGARVLLHVF